MRYIGLLITITLLVPAFGLVEGNRYSTREYGLSLLAPEGWSLLLSIESFLAKVESPEKTMSVGVSAKLFKDPVPLDRFIAQVEAEHGISKKGRNFKEYLKPALAELAGDENKERRQQLETLICDDAPTKEQLEKAAKMAQDRGGISDMPEQTMASRIYTIPPTTPEQTAERSIIVFYIVRRTVGYYYYVTLPPGGFTEALPFLITIFKDANLKALNGGRYALPAGVPIGPPKFGLIQGKVLQNGMEMGGIPIVLYRTESEMKSRKPFMRSTSAYGGEFMINNIPPGRYFALVPEQSSFGASPIYNLTITEGRAYLANIELSP